MSDFDTAQKMKLRIWSYLLKKSVIENFIFVQCEEEDILFFQQLVISTMKKKKKREKKWVRELFRKREEKGALNNLTLEIKLANRESFLR